MRIFRRAPAPTVDQLAELRETAREWMRPGFRARVGLAEELVEFHDDIDLPAPVVLDAAQRIVDEVWRDRLAQESSWPDAGDYARLTNAFASLAEQGVVCRMDFTCCQTCGTAEIDDERTPNDAARQGDYPYQEWAYTFFHQQDTERLVDPNPVLYLSYSAFTPAPALDPDLLERARSGDEHARREVVTLTDVAVGEMVQEALVAQGLDVEWNGTSAQRIGVRVPQWRKPLPK